MKKKFKYAFLSAIALVGAVGFSACSSEDEVADVNPTYDGENVKTQLTIALTDGVVNNNTTRQSAATVQYAQTIASFRGIDSITLIPYASPTDRTARLGSNIIFKNMTMPSVTEVSNSIPKASLLTTSNAVLYNDVTIPVGTSGFLFYGRAKQTATTATFAEGGLNVTTSVTSPGITDDAEIGTIAFSPVKIWNPSTYQDDVADALAAYVTSIAAATHWADCANSANNTEANKAWYNAGLGELYTNFIRLTTGSSLDVQAAVVDLYKSVYKNTDAVSQAIAAAITNSTYASAPATPDGTLTFTAAIGNSSETYWPGKVNLPDGAAYLTWSNATPAVATVDYDGDTGRNNTKAANYVYPANLWYYGNSEIMTADVSKAALYNNDNAWATILAGYDKTSVSSVTRSVAIKDQIQYAVGRLDVTVAKMDAEKYYDRRGEEVAIPAAGYTLTGVLIGGQNKVDYKFEPATEGSYIIYDNVIDGSKALNKTTAAGPTYTLALETVAEKPVYVVLEFINTGADFEGATGVVPAGCKFYMVAQLDPKNDVSGSVSGSANTGNRVFMQDFMTIANFTIGAGDYLSSANDNDGDGFIDAPKGLGTAYNTIPDLRTPEIELGFSVDLSWKEGITFNHTF
ncbi:MAG: hypothetical protein K5683_07280 [Prevotella sp.]|nr:hypothetical protein [Prevotella sp.]